MLSRSPILLAASLALVAVACGDDTSSGTGGGSSSSAATTTTTGGSPTSTTTSSSSTSSSSDGGGTSDGGGGAGDGGTGGEGGAGDGGANVGGGGLGGNPSFEELCEYQSDQIEGYAEELECPVTPAVCVLPDECVEETLAVHDCYYEFLDISDCECLEDLNGELVFFCEPPECDDEVTALFACEDAT